MEKFDVTGMSCSACSSFVQKTVSEVEGVSYVSVNLLTASMEVEYSGEKKTKEVISAVKKAGYGAKLKTAKKPMTDETPDIKDITDEEKKTRVRLIVSLCCWVPLIILSMLGMFLNAVGANIPNFLLKAFYAEESAITLSVCQIVLLAPIVFANQKYFKNGFSALLRKHPNMDSLVAIGSLAAIVYGLFAMCEIGYALGYNDSARLSRYAHDLYFESAGTILTLITLGKYLESKAKGKTSEAITKLVNLVPQTVTVIRNGKEEEIKSEEVKAGEIFILRPGERVAVDGEITEGYSAFDESAITGEPIPREKKVGDKVVSASVNGSGFVKVKATRVGEDTTIAKVIKLVEEAASSKAPIAKTADKIAAVFVPCVMAIALVTFIIWLSVGYGLEFALARGIAVLVISCPCALGLATPVAIMVGTGKGAENGILIKSGEALEKLSGTNTVVLDKTGTVTEGKPIVTDIFGENEGEILRVAGTLEKNSEHPLSVAITSECEKRGEKFENAEKFQADFGLGIQGEIGKTVCFVGNEEYANKFGARLTEEFKERAETYAKQGKSPLFVGKDGKVIGIIAVADVVKTNSAEAVGELKRNGMEVIMLTGDNKLAAEEIGKEIGADKIIAEVKPDEKAEKIRELNLNGKKTVMVGDGINDAPALASANVGLALGAGTDIAIDSADVILVKNDLKSVSHAIKLSKKVVLNIKENLFWAFLYNAVGIPIAAGALFPATGLALSPMIGAAAMSLSSVCVVLNALRLKTVKF